ncbi:hypothetical protein JRI60_19000 [Archangium violaceum]|uniref:hypothetical protein n=1 Tax=Archangium violaceum TaxID=83451 RepID=UPI00194F31D4|nr:hypothetical protein [Archangium violaceum]QRO00969.1 hypothetical protein JRI60_19000 [Archangium violaceum]
MRTCWLLLLGCLTVSCGGNFSNDDLEFINALPTREDLTSKLPRTGDSALEQGLNQRVGQLALGEISQRYVETRRVSDEFNTGLDGLLTVLERIRELPPTTRASELRVWGPWDDSEHAGHELRFVMNREPEHFGYLLQFRRKGSGEEGWWNAVAGTFKPDGGLRKGEGTVQLLLADARDHGYEMKGLGHLDRLDIVYQTRALPIGVQMHFVPSEHSLRPEFIYSYREIPGGLAEMGFLILDVDTILGGRREDVTIISRWTRDQGGVGFVSVTGGDLPAGRTASQVECWNASFRVTYSKRSWDDSEEGSASACPDVSALED